MPQEPKKRHSRQRQGKRRASIKLPVPKGVVCPNCKNVVLPHTICRKCGYYKGRRVIDVTTVKKSKKTQEDKNV